MMKGCQIILCMSITLQLFFQVRTEDDKREAISLRERYVTLDLPYRSKRFADPEPGPTIQKPSKKYFLMDKLVHQKLISPKIHYPPVMPGAIGRSFFKHPFGRLINTMPQINMLTESPTTSATINESSNGSLIMNSNSTGFAGLNSTDSNSTELNSTTNGAAKKLSNNPHNQHDTKAKHGEKCNPTNALYPDYCENAEFPNKGRMICSNNKCDCKFGKQETNAGEVTWVQLRYDAAKEMCLSPKGGVCFIKFPTGTLDANGNPKFVIDIEKAHEQCDDKGGEKLFCSKAHPRRFSSFNQYFYYCLSEKNRAPVEK